MDDFSSYMPSLWLVYFLQCIRLKRIQMDAKALGLDSQEADVVRSDSTTLALCTPNCIRIYETIASACY